jgi:hypothetical protein
MTRESLRKHYARIMKAFEFTPDREIYQSSKMIIDLLNQTEWIPVTERLPDREEYIANNGLFIVSDGERSYSEYFDIYDKKCFGKPTMYGFRVDRVVAAWMPLPQPYKAESEKT